jgi:hypothetical protein
MGQSSIARRAIRYLFRNGYSQPEKEGAITPGTLLNLYHVPLKIWRVLSVLRGVHFDRRFDRKHNVDTSGAIYLRELDIENENENIQYGELYDPFPYRSFKHVMGFLPRDVSSHSFVDYGSGKGRVLLVASDYAFKKIVGVEFSKVLHDVTVANIAAYRSSKQKCFDIESLHVDATEFRTPDGPCVLFLFSPFRGRVLESVLENIKQSHLDEPRDMTLLFVTDPRTHPVPWDQLRKTGVLQPVRSGTFPFDLAMRYPIEYAVFDVKQAEFGGNGSEVR